MSVPFHHRLSPGIVIIGAFIDTPSPNFLRVRRDHYCIISPLTGKITHLAPLSSSRDDAIRILGEEVYRRYIVIWLKSSQFVCPGMIDTHCHAPQFRQLGSANNLPLVFPLPAALRVVGMVK
jgi:guanine deaminase